MIENNLATILPDCGLNRLKTTGAGENNRLMCFRHASIFLKFAELVDSRSKSCIPRFRADRLKIKDPTIRKLFL